MNLNQGGLDNRFAQFPGGQAQPGSTGFGGLGGGMQNLQNIPGGNFNIPSPLRPGGPGGIGGMPGVAGGQPNLAAQQRLGGAGGMPGMQQQLAGARLGVVGGQQQQQQQQQQFGGASAMNGGMQGVRGGVPGGMAGPGGLASNIPGMQPQQQQQAPQQQQQPGMQRPGGLPGGIGSLAGPNNVNLAAMQQQAQQQQQQQRSLSGLSFGGGAGVGGVGGRPGAAGLGGMNSGYGAPSGDLLTMLNKAGGLGPGGRPQEEGPSFNASDFPSLSSGSGQQRHASQDGANETFAALLSNQKAPPPTGPAPSFVEEDFPALPGAGGPGSQHAPRQDGSQGAAQLAQLQQQLGSMNMGGVGSGDASSMDVLRMQQQRLQQQQQQQQQQHAAAAAAGGLKAIQTKPPGMPGAAGGLPGQSPDRFGLLGLLNVIRMTDADLSTLALGTDLTTLGLNLNAPEALWKTFSSPWADGPGKTEPDFRLPNCYLHNPPRLQPAHFAMFQPDTLFYIFYGMPGDEAQLYAADQLASKGWYFHKELKSWLTRVPNTEALQKTDRFERGSFFLFDPTTWDVLQKDNFTVSFDALERPPGLAKAAAAPPPPPAGQQQQQIPPGAGGVPGK